MEITTEEIFCFGPHEGPVYALREHDLTTFFSGSGDRLACSWDISDFKQGSYLVQLDAQVFSIERSRSADILFCGDGKGIVHLINLHTGQEQKTTQLKGQFVFDLLLVNDFLLVAIDSAGWIYGLNTDNLKVEWAIRIADGKLRQIRLHPENGAILVATGDGSIAMVSIDGKLIQRVPAHNGSCYCLMPIAEYNLLYSGGMDAHLNVFNLTNLELLESIPAHNFSVYDLAWDSLSKLLFSGSRDKTIKIWNAANAAFLKRITTGTNKYPGRSVNKLMWHQGSQLLLSGGDDKLIRAHKIAIVG